MSATLFYCRRTDPKMTHKLPIVNIAALFGPDIAARDLVDSAITKAAQFEGMLTLTGLPDWAIHARAQA